MKRRVCLGIVLLLAIGLTFGDSASGFGRRCRARRRCRSCCAPPTCTPATPPATNCATKPDDPDAPVAEPPETLGDATPSHVTDDLDAPKSVEDILKSRNAEQGQIPTDTPKTTDSSSSAEPVRAGERTWTSADGRTIRARLVSMHGTTVTILRSSNQKEYSIEMSRFSAGDQICLAALQLAGLFASVQ
jgi:hypothetical protein